jgi:hypothetical protein
VAWNSLSQTVTIPKQQQWIYHIWGSRTFKNSAKFGSWMTEQQPIHSQLKMFIINAQLGYNMFQLE